MSEFEQRDNEGSLFFQDKSGQAGRGMFNGRKCYMSIVRSGAKSDKAPTHRLFLAYEEPAHEGEAHAIALFKPSGSSKALLNGSFAGHWVNVFLNEAKNENKTQYLGVKFRPKDDEQQAPPPVEDDEIPF